MNRTEFVYHSVESTKNNIKRMAYIESVSTDEATGSLKGIYNYLIKTNGKIAAIE